MACMLRKSRQAALCAGERPQIPNPCGLRAACASAHTLGIFGRSLYGLQSGRSYPSMSNALAFAVFLIYQHQARGLGEQQQLQQLFLAFLAGQITAEQYERDLDLARNAGPSPLGVRRAWPPPAPPR